MEIKEILRTFTNKDEHDNKIQFTAQLECPICMSELFPDERETSYSPCCGQLLCESCKERNMEEQVRNGFTPGVNLPCCFCGQTIDVCSNGSWQELLDKLKVQIRKGDTRAMVALAQQYTRGAMGVPKDINMATLLLESSADAGNPQAALQFAKIRLPTNKRKFKYLLVNVNVTQ
jgi:hypothetical protein